MSNWVRGYEDNYDAEEFNSFEELSATFAASEQLLGRPLRKGENVHHINGIRDDNRPENLELWVRVQPYGTRASELICPSCNVSYLEAHGPAVKA